MREWEEEEERKKGQREKEAEEEMEVSYACLLLSYKYSTHCTEAILTLPMLRLLSSKAQGRKVFLKQSKPCNIGIHWIALSKNSQMSTHMPWFQ